MWVRVRGRLRVRVGGVPLEHLLVPLVAQLGLLKGAELAEGLEGVLVRRELPAAEPRHHLLPRLGAERVDHEARAWVRFRDRDRVRVRVRDRVRVGVGVRGRGKGTRP